MLVYGDAHAHVPTSEVVERLQNGRARLGHCSEAELYDVLVRLLLDAGEITQGLLDLDCKRRGADAESRVRSLLARLGAEIADAFVGSVGGKARIAPSIDSIEEVARARLPASLHITLPEGYLHYALYPELYARAAAKLRGRRESHLRVIGIRSIGASLAPVVAAAFGGHASTTLVRPIGHPFARALAIADDLAREILGGPQDTAFAVVDDGPGLSGSSFGAVGDWLEHRGVRTDRVWYFPSHTGALGPRASDRHRARWVNAKRACVLIDEPFVRSVLNVAAPIEDVSAGRWRKHAFYSESDWPAVNAMLERRKYLVGTHSSLQLFKFAGLGRYGDAKLARAEHLARAGMIPRVLGLSRGFLGMDWLRGERLPCAHAPRAAVVDAVAAYLAELAASFPAPSGRQGASAVKLLGMATHNAGEALGSIYARELERWSDRIASIGRRMRYVFTDNKMHAWEWLVLENGRLLKCDALDHSTGHDLVGAQDIAWDVAGSQVELDLSPEEVAHVSDRIGRRAGTRALPSHLPFFVDMYLAFQLGVYTLAQEQTTDTAELTRLRETARRYAERLRRRIET